MLYFGVDTSDAVRIDELFKQIPDADKNMALGYLSALADKSVVDKGKQPQAVT